MSLEGDCQELEVTYNLELLVTFPMSLEFGMSSYTISLQTHI